MVRPVKNVGVQFDLPQIIGTEINYYFVCERKLWFFSRHITMEHNSQHVEIGRILHEESFKREKKEILIDGTIMVDFSSKELTIHETKSTTAIDEASRYQVLYYIYYLEKKGVEGVKGIIHYYKNRQKEQVFLTDNERKKLDEIIERIEEVKNLGYPPEGAETKICKKCSYYELCFC